MLPGADGDFQMEADGLHIWPRGHFMLMALPNPDKRSRAPCLARTKGQTAWTP